MGLITPRTFRGTRDFLPSDLIARRQVLSVIEEAYRRYGFQPLETPAIEYLDILTGKSEENDKLIYEIKRARGEEVDTAETAIALRYDLTVPLARVVAQYPELPRPFKRYQIQPVWRADRPQPRQGRFREFVQCDADIVGTSSLLADAEIIALTYEVLRDLGFENFLIRVSSRKFLHGLSQMFAIGQELFPQFCRALDKLDKIGQAGVESELVTLGIDATSVMGPLAHLRGVLRHPSPDFDQAFQLTGLNKEAWTGLDEIRTLYETANMLGVPAGCMYCDPMLVRGLDYYTGPIFETVIPGMPHIGSLTGGGRYDRLVETFSKQSVPATGTTIGLDRIQTALTQVGKFSAAASTTQVLIARFDSEGVAENLKIAAELRHAGIRVEIWYDDDRMKVQFAYADKQGIPLVIIAGPDERARGLASVKTLATKEQREAPRAELTTHIQTALRAL